MLLHGGGLVFLLVMILLQSLQRVPPEHVFELVSVPQTSEHPQAEPEARPEPTPNLPRLDPLTEPAPRPQPRPEPPPELISADQFRQEFGEPRPQERPVQRRHLEVPRIDMSQLQQELQSMVVSTSSQRVDTMSTADQDAISQYISALRGRINSVWEQPSNYTGNLREVVVVFHVDSNGRITRVRLESGNANDPFARSVLNAFDRVRPVGPPPERQSYTFRLPFRMVDR